MPWEPQHDTRDREIAARMNAGARVEDVAAEHGLAPRGVLSVMRRVKERDRKAEHALSVQATKTLCPVRRPVLRLSAQLMAEIAAARAEMSTAPIYRGGW